jgi:hypothetical protein
MKYPNSTPGCDERHSWPVHHNNKKPWALLAAVAYIACSLALAVAALLFLGGTNSRAEAATDVTSYSAESSTISPSGYASTFNDSTALGGQALEMWRNSSATKTLALSKPADELVIRAKGGLCNGAPRMQVSVGGTEVINTLVSDTTYTNFSKMGPLLSGSQTITVSFTNDYYVNSNCDRNLYVDHVYLRSNDSSSPPPPSLSSNGTIYFQDRFERSFNSANMRGDGSTSANNGLVPPWDWGNAAASNRMTPSTSVVRAGSQSSKWTVYGGDRSPDTVTENPRAQLNYGAGSNGRFCEGDERWIAWSMYFPAGFHQHTSGDWTILPTIGWGHPYGNLPSPITVFIDGGDRIKWRTNGISGTERWSEALQRGQWYDFTFHVKFSRDRSVGYIEFWKNGVRQTFGGQSRVYTNTLPTTNVPYCGNLQLANYYRYEQTGSQTIYYDEVKVGTSYAVVQPGS